MSRRRIEPGTPAEGIVHEEIVLYGRVATAVSGRAPHEGPVPGAAYDQELISLRDQIAEAKPEDVAPLVEQMARVAAVAAGRRRDTQLPIDPTSPYFAHLRLREAGRPHDTHSQSEVVPSESTRSSPEGETEKSPQTIIDGPRVRDILIGRKGFIDRASGVHVVDWRDAPVSQIYYRYDEGDDYDEIVDKRHLEGVVEARRNVTIQSGSLRRIGCPQGTYVADGEGRWWEAEGVAAPTLEGGQGKAARPPRQTAPVSRPAQRPGPKHGPRKVLGVHSGPVPRADKHLPEIAALIDPAQFELITAPSTGLVVIQGGAGSGKTTVALHRVAYLTFNDPLHFKPSRYILIGASDFLRAWWWLVLAAAIGAIWGFRRWLRAPEARRRYDAFKLRLPLIGRITRGNNAARFARTFAILTASAVPVLEALRISGEVVTNTPMRLAVEGAAVRVREGAPIARSLGASKLFPPMLIHLVASGETSGELEEMLERAATNQERELDGVVNTAVGILGPAMILLMGGFVFVIVIALLLPIFQLNQLVG